MESAPVSFSNGNADEKSCSPSPLVKAAANFGVSFETILHHFPGCVQNTEKKICSLSKVCKKNNVSFDRFVEVAKKHQTSRKKRRGLSKTWTAQDIKYAKAEILASLQGDTYSTKHDEAKPDHPMEMIHDSNRLPEVNLGRRTATNPLQLVHAASSIETNGRGKESRRYRGDVMQPLRKKRRTENAPKLCLETVIAALRLISRLTDGKFVIMEDAGADHRRSAPWKQQISMWKRGNASHVLLPVRDDEGDWALGIIDLQAYGIVFYVSNRNSPKIGGRCILAWSNDNGGPWGCPPVLIPQVQSAEGNSTVNPIMQAFFIAAGVSSAGWANGHLCDWFIRSLSPENGMLAIPDDIEAEAMHTRLDTLGGLSRAIIALLDMAGHRATGMRLIEQTINNLLAIGTKGCDHERQVLTNARDQCLAFVSFHRDLLMGMIEPIQRAQGVEDEQLHHQS